MAAAGALALAVPVSAQDAPPLNPRTAQSDLPLEGPRAAMQIERVSLGIEVDPKRQHITGLGRYQLVVREDLGELAFDLDPRFRIFSVVVDGETLAPESYANPDGVLSLRLPEPVARGTAMEVQIGYEGRPHVAANAPWDGGFVWAQTPAGEPWIATAVQGEGCDLFWPCIDHSSSRIDVMDTLITVPEGLVAAGNGALVETIDRGNGTTTYHWRARNPSNYGIALQIGPYETVEQQYRSRYGNTIPLVFWHLPGNGEEARRLLVDLAIYLDFFESVIGPYPFADEKAGVVETPHLGMEHQTINAYGNRFERDPLGYDWLLHHEFAHEWFANQLTHASINHMWLHEGIGTWMQPLYLGWLRGRMLYNAEMWDSRTQIVSRVPLVPPAGELPDYNDREAGWGTDIYYKGAWVMHTLRYLVGDDVLFAALRRLTYGTDTPVPGEIRPVSRTTEDFRRILEEATGDDLEWFFDAYFYQADLPFLLQSREEGRLTLEWLTPSQLPFEMPVTVLIDGEEHIVDMPEGRGQIAVPSYLSHVLVDPYNQILMYDEDIAAAADEAG